MPLAKYFEVEKATTVGVWDIKETIDELTSQLYLNNEELLALDCFKTEHRKKQWLSYRVLIRLLVKIEGVYKINYLPNGKPILDYPPRNISVSHSDDISAIIISENYDNHLGIDVELINPKIMMLKSRFLSPIEAISTSVEPSALIYTIYWSAKEAVYKSLNKGDISIRGNIFIESCLKENNIWRVRAKAYINSKILSFLVISQKLDNYILSYTVQPKEN